MICQTCGIEAPTRSVQFHAHTGMLIMMRHSQIGGKQCKNCINKHFTQYTGWTALAGWWGMVSFFITPCVLVWNTGLWLSTLGLQAPPPGARPPELTDEAVEKLGPYTERIFDALNGGKKVPEMAEEIGKLAGVSPMQVILYTQAVIQAAKDNS